MPFELEKPTYCNMCDPTPDGPSICSPYDRLTWAVYHFSYCPYCGRFLLDKTEEKE